MRFPQTLQSWLVCLLLLALTALVVRVFVSAGRLESRVGETTSAAQTLVLEAQSATAEARGFIADQREIAEENKKSIEAAVQLGAVFNASGRLVNTQLIPRLMKTADASTLAILSLNENALTLNKALTNLDTRVSGPGGVLEAAIFLTQSLERSAGSLGVTLDTLQRMIAVVSEKTGIIGDEMILLVSNPQLHQMIQNATLTSSEVAKSSQLVTATMEEVKRAMESAPGIAQNLEKISKETSKLAKISLIAGILATLARAFLIR
jgi:hypothetical protein